MMSDLKKAFSDRQRVVVAICFALFIINTQLKQTMAPDSPFFVLSFQTAELIMSFVILSYYRLDHLIKHKAVYIIYSIIGLIAGIVYICIRFRAEYSYLYLSIVAMVAGIYVMGICAICTFTWYINDKNKFAINRPAFAIWCILMFLMCVSAGSYNLYALRFAICFLMFFLAPQSEDQRKSVFEGMVAGIILGFVLEFSFCLLFRPYDWVRYLGNFSNPNHNCLFLDFVFAAILGGLLSAYKNESSRLVKVILYVLLGADLACIYMTACRSGWLAAFVILVIYLISFGKILGRNVLKHLCLLALVFVIGLPVTYAAVRYVPLTNPYVKFYFYDNHNFHTVHRENKYDQSNYITFMNMLTSPARRLFSMLGINYTGTENIEEAIVEASFNPAEKPLLTFAEAKDPVLVRYTIYKWYFDRLSLRGIPYEDQGFQLTADHWVQDTHNIFLAYGTDYGVPAMILFIILIIYGEVCCLREALKQKNVIYALSAMMIILPPVFGMFEYAWGYGLISMIAMYFVMKNIVIKNSRSISVTNDLSD